LHSHAAAFSVIATKLHPPLYKRFRVKKPIVAFDLPEHRFSAQDAALYVRPNDELEFARALAQLMDDAKRRRDMGLSGRKRIETELAWQYSVPHLLEAYRRVLF
jgi:glycosyltransferase involved in cell wall biosynthesis